MYEVSEMLALLHLLPKIFNIIMAFEYTGGTGIPSADSDVLIAQPRDSPSRPVGLSAFIYAACTQADTCSRGTQALPVQIRTCTMPAYTHHRILPGVPP